MALQTWISKVPHCGGNVPSQWNHWVVIRASIAPIRATATMSSSLTGAAPICPLLDHSRRDMQTEWAFLGVQWPAPNCLLPEKSPWRFTRAGKVPTRTWRPQQPISASLFFTTWPIRRNQRVIKSNELSAVALRNPSWCTPSVSPLRLLLKTLSWANYTKNASNTFALVQPFESSVA